MEDVGEEIKYMYELREERTLHILHGLRQGRVDIEISGDDGDVRYVSFYILE